MTDLTPDMTKRATLAHYDVNRILDDCRFGDHITVTRTNGGNTTSTVSGPVLCAPDLDKAVGIDLLDGQPHLLRTSHGHLFGEFLDVQVTTPRKDS